MGAGRGHLVKLARVARALGPGLRVTAALSALRFADELRSTGARVRRCPPLRPDPAVKADPRLRGNATWACYLAAAGLLDDATIRHSLAYWRSLIVSEDISILVADYAPLALLAARSLKAEGWDIRTIIVGTGYGVPPASLERFPNLPGSGTRIVHPEEEVTAALNRALAETGSDPLPRLSALYAADLALAATFAFLDPYASHRAATDLCPPLVDLSPALAAGEELFVYFSRDEAEAEDLCSALCALPMPRRGYLPALSAATRDRLLASGMILEPAPVPPARIAERSRMILHPAPHGTLCMAALAGLPQIGLPGHREQMAHARRAEEAGILRLLPPGQAPAEAILHLVTAAWTDAEFHARARAVATGLRQGFPADPMQDLGERLAPELAAARAFVTG